MSSGETDGLISGLQILQDDLRKGSCEGWEHVECSLLFFVAILTIYHQQSNGLAIILAVQMNYF